MVLDILTNAVSSLAGSTVMFITFELLLFFISALFIWIGAKIASVDKGSIIRSFIIAVLIAILTPLLLIPFSEFALVSVALSFIINLAIIKIVFATGWKKSLVTWVFSLIAEIISIFLLMFVLVLLV